MRSTIFFTYFKNRQKVILLIAILLAIIFLVYGLYGIIWGPAIYTALIMLFVILGFGIIDFRAYDKKIQQLRLLKKQAAVCLGELLQCNHLAKEGYLDIIQILERRCLQTEEKARQDAADATRYYTLWSHQIKNPLAAMRLLLQEDALDRKALERELFKTEQYVDMALQYQRLGMSCHDLVFQEYALDAVVRQAVRRVTTLFIHKKIGIDIAPMDRRILTDEKWLVFVLEQLLTNAVKYTQEGMVSIYLAENEPAALVIEDTGIGIQPEDLSRVFEWGYTGYNGRLDKRSTGIGLSLCKQALTLLGNSIDITSVVGKGTKVTLDLSREKIDVE